MMQQSVRRRHNQAPVYAAIAVAAGGVVASFALTALAGTKTGFVLAVSAIGGPVLIYLSIVAPLIFPFGAYVALIPFNNILNIDAFGTLTKALGIVSGAALLFYLLRTRTAVTPPRTLLFWAAVYVWTATTTFWAIDQPSVFVLLPTIVELLTLYAVVSILPTDRNVVRWVTLATVFGGVAASLYGAYLFHSGADIGAGRLWIKTDTSEIDPNQFAAALLLPLGLVGVFALYSRRVWTIAAYLGAAVILLVGIAESGSRGAVLGVGVMLVYVFIRSERRMRLALWSIPGALLVLLATLRTSIWTRFGDAVSTGGAGRLPIWHIGLVAVKSHWLFGAGLNNFAFAFDEAFLQAHVTEPVTWHRAPHDLLLGTTVEIGVIGLALLLTAWYQQFRVLRDIPMGNPDYPLRVALEATVLGTFVAALFLDVMIFKYVWLTFMLMVIVRNAHYRLGSRVERIPVRA
jgi:putative inorganic carbon (hco3(-)) transporter